MTNFVLVHGAMHGAWCWERVVPILEKDPRVGQVVAIDLPGHGAMREAMPLEEIRPDDYVAHVVKEIESRDLADIVLVGHSLAGITLPSVAHRIAGRIKHVVFLAATVPAVGTSIDDSMTHPLSPISRGTPVETMFCNDLDEADTAWLLSQLCGEPPNIMNQVIETVRAPADLASTFIVLDRDEALPPDYQLEQAETAGVREILHFDSGHSAFASRPADLSDLLLRFTED